MGEYARYYLTDYSLEMTVVGSVTPLTGLQCNLDADTENVSAYK